MRKARPSGASVCLEKLVNMPTGTLVNKSTLRRGDSTTVTLSAAANILNKLHNAGAISKKERGLYMIDVAKVRAYRMTHKEHPRFVALGYRAPKGLRSQPVKVGMEAPKVANINSLIGEPPGSGITQDMDMDVIDNLLTAMEQAEPVLKRYKEMHDKIMSFFK